MTRAVPAVGETGYARLAGDCYDTPAWVTEALLDAVTLPNDVWEPAAGAWHMVAELCARGYAVTASDVAPRSNRVEGLDFLTAEPRLGVRCIVTNPPFSLATEFVERALAQVSVVAMLLPFEWDAAGGRVELFRRKNFAMKLTLTRRIQWVGLQHTASPRKHHAWFVWNSGHRGVPAMRWA
jgi:hypothetical protein